MSYILTPNISKHVALQDPGTLTDKLEEQASEIFMGYWVSTGIIIGYMKEGETEYTSFISVALIKYPTKNNFSESVNFSSQFQVTVYYILGKSRYPEHHIYSQEQREGLGR